MNVLQKTVSNVAVAPPPTAGALRAALASTNFETVRRALIDIAQLGAAGRDLAPDLQRLIRPDGQQYLMQQAEIALVAVDQPPDRGAIDALLDVARHGRGSQTRIDAMTALSRFGHGPEELGAVFQAIAWQTNGAEFDQDVIAAFNFAAVAQGNRDRGSGSGGGTSALPDFTWPPPRYSTHDTLDRRFFNGDAARLKDVDARLESALAAAGFRSNGLYQIPGGFAIATRLEQTTGNWDLVPSEHRWDQEQIGPRNLAEYVAALVRRPPGLYRLIVFAVTDASAVANEKKELTQAEAATLAVRGGGALPDSIGNLSFRGRQCYALIYEYQKRYNEISMYYPGKLDGHVHLEKARILDDKGNLAAR
jgi:hypothetical protein